MEKAFRVLQGKTLTAGTTAKSETGLRISGRYAISNVSTGQIAYINTQGLTSDIAKDMPIFPNETKYIKTPLGSINYKADTASTLLLLNEISVY